MPCQTQWDDRSQWRAECDFSPTKVMAKVCQQGLRYYLTVKVLCNIIDALFSLNKIMEHA